MASAAWMKLMGKSSSTHTEDKDETTPVGTPRGSEAFEEASESAEASRLGQPDGSRHEDQDRASDPTYIIQKKTTGKTSSDANLNDTTMALRENKDSADAEQGSIMLYRPRTTSEESHSSQIEDYSLHPKIPPEGEEKIGLSNDLGDDETLSTETSDTTDRRAFPKLKENDCKFLLCLVKFCEIDAIDSGAIGNALEIDEITVVERLNHLKASQEGFDLEEAMLWIHGAGEARLSENFVESLEAEVVKMKEEKIELETKLAAANADKYSWKGQAQQLQGFIRTFNDDFDEAKGDVDRLKLRNEILTNQLLQTQKEAARLAAENNVWRKRAQENSEAIFSPDTELLEAKIADLEKELHQISSDHRECIIKMKVKEAEVDLLTNEINKARVCIEMAAREQNEFAAELFAADEQQDPEEHRVQRRNELHRLASEMSRPFDQESFRTERSTEGDQDDITFNPAFMYGNMNGLQSRAMSVCDSPQALTVPKGDESETPPGRRSRPSLRGIRTQFKTILWNKSPALKSAGSSKRSPLATTANDELPPFLDQQRENSVVDVGTQTDLGVITDVKHDTARWVSANSADPDVPASIPGSGREVSLGTGRDSPQLADRSKRVTDSGQAFAQRQIAEGRGQENKGSQVMPPHKVGHSPPSAPSSRIDIAKSREDTISGPLGEEKKNFDFDSDEKPVLLTKFSSWGSDVRKVPVEVPYSPHGTPSTWQSESFPSDKLGVSWNWKSTLLSMVRLTNLWLIGMLLMAYREQHQWMGANDVKRHLLVGLRDEFWSSDVLTKLTYDLEKWVVGVDWGAHVFA